MLKPTKQAQWATDDNYPASGEPYTGTPTKVEPTSGRKQQGHEPSKRPPAQQFNWWQNLVYLWIAWITTREHLLENWKGANVSGTVPAPGWTAVIVSSSTGTVMMPDTNFRERYVLVVLPMAAGVPTYTLTPEWLAFLHDGQVIEIEQSFRTGALNTVGSNFDLGMQLRNNGGTPEYVIFRCVAGAGNWRAIKIDQVGTANADTTIAIAANTTYKFKMRVEGPTVAGLGAGLYRVTWFINDTQVSQQTLDPTTVDQIRYYFQSYSTASGQGDPGVRLGRLKIAYGGA